MSTAKNYRSFASWKNDLVSPESAGKIRIMPSQTVDWPHLEPDGQPYTYAHGFSRTGLLPLRGIVRYDPHTTYKSSAKIHPVWMRRGDKTQENVCSSCGKLVIDQSGMRDEFTRDADTRSGKFCMAAFDAYGDKVVDRCILCKVCMGDREKSLRGFYKSGMNPEHFAQDGQDVIGWITTTIEAAKTMPFVGFGCYPHRPGAQIMRTVQSEGWWLTWFLDRVAEVDARNASAALSLKARLARTQDADAEAEVAQEETEA